MNTQQATFRLSFVGSAGIPNCYGGFESFLEHCGPIFAERVASVVVTCDARLYPKRESSFKGIALSYVAVAANGAWSVFHDLIAFFKVFLGSSHIVVLGVSGGPWFPLMRVLCDLTGKRLIVNVDGLEWRRSKFSLIQRKLLKIFDALAQWSSHVIVVDNEGLIPFLTRSGKLKAQLIAYSGDHVYPYLVEGIIKDGSALTICRIEPENQLEMLIESAIGSNDISEYTIVGNWVNSKYGIDLRAKYTNVPKLKFLDPIYDLELLGQLRSSCQFYLHGHSVGGTNPSLVEILFFDCNIYAFDCTFNRATAGDGVDYFSSIDELIDMISIGRNQLLSRSDVRKTFSASDIVDKYLVAFSV